MTQQSAHPLSIRLANWLAESGCDPVTDFEEIPGKGLSGTVEGHRIRIDVSSSNFPRFDLNPNTGEPLGGEETALGGETGESVRTARHAATDLISGTPYRLNQLFPCPACAPGLRGRRARGLDLPFRRVFGAPGQAAYGACRAAGAHGRVSGYLVR